MPRAQPTVFRAFDGINNLAAEHRLKPSELRQAVNVDIDGDRAVRRRGGHGAPIAGTATAHSGFSALGIFLYRLGTSLYRLLPDLTSIVLKTGLTSGARMHYAAAPNRIFLSDGFWQGWTDGEQVHDWGIRPPAYQPSAAAVSGGRTPKGKYLYTMTFLRDDGEESGAIASGTVELTEVGGISFTSVPVSAQADVVRKCIYLTKPNGKKLFRAVLLTNAQTSGAYYGTTHDLKGELETQFLREPPPGRVLDYMNGRMLVGDGRHVWYNPHPYKLELFSPLAVRPQSSQVNAFAVVEDGVFVGLEGKIDFHAGADFVEATVIPKAKYGACLGGVAYLEGSRVLRGLPGRAAVMLTKQGACVCANGGVFQNVTETRYQYAAPKRVAVMARDVDDFTQVVAVMR